MLRRRNGRQADKPKNKRIKNNRQYEHVATVRTPHAPLLKKPQSAPLRRIWRRATSDKQENTNNMVEVKFCGAYGLGQGVFAKQALPVGEWVLEYAGERKGGLDWDALESSQTRYMWDVGGGEAIDAEQCGNEARFLNHYQHLGAGPNLVAENVREEDGVHVVFRTASLVRAGEQLLIDYGTFFAPGERLVGVAWLLPLRLRV